jgi:GNAT superfamily N-acetyltransferase
MGNIHVRAWQAAHRGLMPNDYLDALAPEDRATMWAHSLASPLPGQLLFVVEDDGTVRGFAAAGPEASQADETDSAELYAINLDPSSWGRGLGRLLLTAVERTLAAVGYTQAVLWVLPANHRAIRLYETAGWTEGGEERQAEVLGVRVVEVPYRRELAGQSSSH